ncbi:MAG: pyridoxal-dependent decarboxylase [Pyrinomonadaceae bacterium]|nr:pyridoxal-dependent decarboxylase [Pyrinomonadaceae bacterium]
MDDKHLAWFLGPKAENSELFVDTLMAIIQDYIHWRRNYYPSDNLLITKRMQREHEEEHDKLYQNVTEMMSLLRRNFPFYSPRYIAHMLSDVSMPSMLGYFAGMLYNSNNVTPEAAPVTVEWEIEACNEILKMLGFKPAPTPPKKDASKKDWEVYERELKSQFGWGHITSGGTVANIEALWVARIVKYFPLAVQEVAKTKGLSIEVKKPGAKPTDEPNKIDELSKYEIVNIKPNESIYLYAKFVDAVKQANQNTEIDKVGEIASDWLSKSKYGVGAHLGKVFSEFPPVIFTSGAAHYSVKKAADILGIGRNNVVVVKTDSQFRMDVKDLELKINQALDQGKVPLAVVAVGSTTEEGAVDPVHEILDLREKFQNEKDISFWLHVDSAWGGYIASLFRLEEEEEVSIILDKILFQLNILDSKPLSLGEKIQLILNSFENDTIEVAKEADNQSNKVETAETSKETDTKFEKEDASVLRQTLEGYGGRLDSLSYWANVKDYLSFISELKKLIVDFGTKISFKKNRDAIEKLSDSKIFELSITDRSDETSEYVSDKITIKLNNHQEERLIKWGGKPLISSFLAFKNVDSITVDPHKMGYIQYPCGVVAFKNDRVRHFIMQRAPYITSSSHNALIHNPPRHIKNIDFKKLKEQNAPYDVYQIGTDAFAPFILEGSKPGAAAASLWLSTKTVPLNRKNHGLIIRSSLLAARELYEWLNSWNKFAEKALGKNLLYEFTTFGAVPDTNVVVFAIKDKNNETINGINKLTEQVYNYFTIQAELGDKQHSYSQPFFISKTKMEHNYYNFDSFEGFFNDCNLRSAKREYIEKGLTVLRATIMNPYISSIRQKTDQNLVKEFIIELHKASQSSARKLIKEEEE